MPIAEEGTAQAAPEPEIVIGTREQLLHLLAEAAEIEHTLMCSYLFAAFSLKRAGEAGRVRKPRAKPSNAGASRSSMSRSRRWGISSSSPT